MLHPDDSLFHAIVAAHADPDPRVARRFIPFSSTPPNRHVPTYLRLPERPSSRRSNSALGLVQMRFGSTMRGPASPASPARPGRFAVLASVRAGVASAVSAMQRPDSVPGECQTASSCTSGCS